VALELIYTSAPRGLKAGSSGYCTVAQTRGLREDLAAALERRSLYAHEPGDSSPVYFSFRPLSLGGASWRVLSRAQDAGLDFTGRRHYLVHHLVLDPSEEPNGLQPAEILLGWKGWREKWEGTPKELEALPAADWWRDLPRIRLPAQEWKRQAGDAGWAAFPHQLTSPVGWLASHLTSQEILQLMAESMALREKAQGGGSWLHPFDAGGPANPVPKDCVWAGRAPWSRSGTPSGLRSVFRIEECRGKPAQGKAEDVEQARTGRGRAAARIDASEPERAVSAVSGQTAASGRTLVDEHRSRGWRRMALVAGLAVLGLAAGGAWWWQRDVRPESAPVFEEMTGITSSPAENSRGTPPDPAPSQELPASPGLALQRALWQEAGGESPIQVLHLLFGKPATPRLLESELGLLLQGGPGRGLVRGPGGWTGPISLEGTEEQRNFCRQAAQKNGAWSLFVPAASRGLAYLPDPFRDGPSRLLPARGQGPRDVLEELGKRIFLEPSRWSLLVIFPPWGKQEFMTVRIGLNDPDRLWMDRVDQHRIQMRNLRGQALRQLAPWLGEDPETWDEKKIRQLTLQTRGGQFPEIFDQFTKVNGEYRQWWLPPAPGESPRRIFSRLLEHPRLRCEVQLDELAIGRLVP